jgi:hypothetical protein
MFGQMEDPRAVSKERRVAFSEIETALVEFRERSNQRGGRAALSCRKRCDLGQEFFVGEMRNGNDRHHIPL